MPADIGAWKDQLKTFFNLANETNIENAGNVDVFCLQSVGNVSGLTALKIDFLKALSNIIFPFRWFWFARFRSKKTTCGKSTLKRECTKSKNKEHWKIPEQPRTPLKKLTTEPLLTLN